MSGLTEEVKCRVDPKLKQQLRDEAKRSERSEGAIVRMALRDFLKKRGAK